MNTVRISAKAGLHFLLIVLLAACASRPLDPWVGFMDSVIKSASSDDTDALTSDLTLYRWEEIVEFYRQASVVEVIQDEARPTEEQLYAAMRADVQMFVRSYKDLFNGQAVKTSTKRLDIDGVDCYSVILWVRKGQTYSGILIHAVWKRPKDFKVLEWVDTSPASAAGVELWSKRARLNAADPTQCVFPERIEFDQVIKQ